MRRIPLALVPTCFGRDRFLGGAFALLLLVGVAPASGQPPSLPSAGDVATALGFDGRAIRDAQAGRVVSRSLQESSRSEIGAAVAMIVRAPVGPLQERLLGQGFADLDPAVQAQGPIQVPATAQSFAALRIPPAELTRLSQAQAGDDLNLSTEEIASLRAAAPNGAEAVGDAYRGLLAARVEAYRARGPAGIAPYARARGGSVSAGDALRSALQAENAVRTYVPAFHVALAGSPPRLPAGFEERYLWSLVDVQGRPAVALIHRVVSGPGEVAGLGDRHFYASHGYNALQILVGFFPVQGGTAVLYTNRTHTDQVGRFGRMAQSIGRRMLVAEVTQLFEAVQRAFAR